MFFLVYKLPPHDLIREEMAQGTAFRFRVISGSMAPLIAAGDEVVVQRADAEGLRQGDIVLLHGGWHFSYPSPAIQAQAEERDSPVSAPSRWLIGLAR